MLLWSSWWSSSIWWWTRLLWSTRSLFAVALVLRLCLLVYGEWQDRVTPALKYTDIDYAVFTDAARFVHSGGGRSGGHAPDGGGDHHHHHASSSSSPYRRATYRYTPLLAWLLQPNVLWWPAAGKLLFVLSDLLVGWLLLQMSASASGGNASGATATATASASAGEDRGIDDAATTTTPPPPPPPSHLREPRARSTTTRSRTAIIATSTNTTPTTTPITMRRSRSGSRRRRRSPSETVAHHTHTHSDTHPANSRPRPPPQPTLADDDDSPWKYLAPLWLCNPFVIAISTRGNAESLLCAMTVLTAYLLLRRQEVGAALVHGLSVHFKIYPILYALPILVYLGGGDDERQQQQGDGGPVNGGPVDGGNRSGAGYKTWWYLCRLFSWRRIRFGLVSGGTFLLLTGAMYWMYVKSMMWNEFTHSNDAPDMVTSSCMKPTYTTSRARTTVTTSPCTFTRSTSATRMSRPRRWLYSPSYRSCWSSLWWD